MKRLLCVMLSLIMMFAFIACSGGEDVDEELEALNAYKATAKADLEDYANEKGQENYTDENWTDIMQLVSKRKNEIDAAKNAAEIDLLLATGMGEIDMVKKEVELANEWDIEDVEDIRIDIAELKTQYSINEDLDFSGLIVKAKMNDDSLIILKNEDYEIDASAYNKNEAGVYRVAICLGEYKANFFAINSIVLEEKEPWEGDIHETISVWEPWGGYEYKNNYGDYGFYIKIDKSFADKAFTTDDFKMFNNLKNISWESIYESYFIEINTKDRQDVLDTMRQTEKLDFVKSSFPIYLVYPG